MVVPLHERGGCREGRGDKGNRGEAGKHERPPRLATSHVYCECTGKSFVTRPLWPG
jgi:hypothetical protein